MTTPEQINAAREALDNLDDYARMETGVNAIGPRSVLENFITSVEQAALEWRASAGADAQCKIGVGTGEGNLFVHGDYDSIKAVQAIILRMEDAEANLISAEIEVASLRAQLATLSRGNNK